MATFGETLDYTDKDEDAIRARLTNLISGVFPEWTDHNRANFGNILLGLFSFVGGILTFYQDNQANESRITTARQRKNLIALAKLLGFRPSGATAATVDLKVTLAAVPAQDVEFTAGDTFRTKDVTSPVIFQNLTTVTMLGGANPPEIILALEHSRNASDVVQSTGAPNQEYLLGTRPFLDGSLTATAADGLYTVVDTLLSSSATDKHMTVTVDQNDRATVRFGNGASGKIPVGTVTFNYKIGGGSEGNVEAGTIKRPDKSYTDAFGAPVIASCTNELGASGGGPRMTIEEIREQAPLSIRAITRTVSREDYEINAKKDSRVARALMLTSNEKPGIAENTGRLYIVPVGGGTPSPSLLSDVFTLVTVTYPNTLTFKLFMNAAVYKSVNVSTKVYPGPSETPSAVRQQILDNLQAFFALSLEDGSANPLIDFGFYFKDSLGEPASELAFSDVYNVVRDTAGVRKIDDGEDGLKLNGTADDVALALEDFPVLGTLTVINGDTGLPI